MQFSLSLFAVVAAAAIASETPQTGIFTTHYGDDAETNTRLPNFRVVNRRGIHEIRQRGLAQSRINYERYQYETQRPWTRTRTIQESLPSLKQPVRVHSFPRTKAEKQSAAKNAHQIAPKNRDKPQSLKLERQNSLPVTPSEKDAANKGAAALYTNRDKATISDLVMTHQKKLVTKILPEKIQKASNSLKEWDARAEATSRRFEKKENFSSNASLWKQTIRKHYTQQKDSLQSDLVREKGHAQNMLLSDMKPLRR